jgi:hypothetical protein
MQIEIINKSNQIPARVELIKDIASKIIKYYKIPAMTIELGNKHNKDTKHLASGWGYYTKPYICINTYKKTILCMTKLIWTIWHEILHTFNLKHKQMTPTMYCTPCSDCPTGDLCLNYEGRWVKRKIGRAMDIQNILKI